MTERNAYNDLLRNTNYKDGCYPSTRYSEVIGKDSTTMDIRDAKILLDGHAYTPYEIDVDSVLGDTRITCSAYLDPSNRSSYIFRKPTTKPLTIENVIFNPPATIVFWSDKTKTIVKADYDYESYDPEKGIAMAIAKKMLGDNKGRYYDIFKHWREKWDKQNETVPDIKIDIPKNPSEQAAQNLRNAFNLDELLP